MIAALQRQLYRGKYLIGVIAVLDSAVDNGIVEDKGLGRGRIAGCAVAENIVTVRAGDLGLAEEQIISLYRAALDNNVFCRRAVGRIHDGVDSGIGNHRDDAVAGSRDIHAVLDSEGCLGAYRIDFALSVDLCDSALDGDGTVDRVDTGVLASERLDCTGVDHDIVIGADGEILSGEGEVAVESQIAGRIDAGAQIESTVLVVIRSDVRRKHELL